MHYRYEAAWSTPANRYYWFPATSNILALELLTVKKPFDDANVRRYVRQGHAAPPQPLEPLADDIDATGRPPQRAALKKGLVTIAFDTLPVELDYLKGGYLQGLVGQKYWGWGYDTVQMIYDKIVNGMTSRGYQREIAEAVHRQLLTLDFTAPFLRAHPKAFELAQRVAEYTPAGLNRIFFTNSGSEAVDTAMKAALMFHRVRGQSQRQLFVSRERAYHGVNMGGVALAGMVNIRGQLQLCVSLHAILGLEGGPTAGAVGDVAGGGGNPRVVDRDHRSCAEPRRARPLSWRVGCERGSRPARSWQRTARAEFRRRWE